MLELLNPLFPQNLAFGKPFVVVQVIAGESIRILRRETSRGEANLVFQLLVDGLQRIKALPGLHSDVYEDSFVYIAKAGRVLQVFPNAPIDRVQMWTSKLGMPLA